MLEGSPFQIRSEAILQSHGKKINVVLALNILKTDKWLPEMGTCVPHYMEYYSAVRKNETMKFAGQ